VRFDSVSSKRLGMLSLSPLAFGESGACTSKVRAPHASLSPRLNAPAARSTYLCSDWRSDQSIADVWAFPWLLVSPVVRGGNLSDKIIALEGAAFNLNAGTVVQQTRPVVRRARSAGALPGRTD
jgi:hypothetical protein